MSKIDVFVGLVAVVVLVVLVVVMIVNKDKILGSCEDEEPLPYVTAGKTGSMTISADDGIGDAIMITSFGLGSLDLECSIGDRIFFEE